MRKLTIILMFLFVLLAMSHNAEETNVPKKIGKTLKGCTAVGGYSSGDFTIRYEKVQVIAITPQGSDYWVLYPDDPDRHKTREKGVLKALALPVEEFIEDGKPKQVQFTEHKMTICKCPPFFWGPGLSSITAEK